MGSRGAAVECVSAIDIALWDIRGKVLGQPIYELLGGAVRDEIALYTHPDQSKFTSKEGVVRGDQGHRRVRSYRAEVRSFPPPGPQGRRRGPRMARRLSRWQHDPQGRAQGRRAHRADPRNGGARYRDPDRRAWPLRRADRHPPLPDLEEAGQIDWFEEPCPPESLNALKQVREKVSAPISWGERGHTKWDFVPVLENKLADYIMPDVTWTGGITELKKISRSVRSLLHPGLAARRGGTDQRGRRRAGDDDRSEFLQARNLGVEPEQVRSISSTRHSTIRTAASSCRRRRASASR